MKNLKPFTFWIVCGIIVLVELGFLAFWSDTDADGRTAAQVKQDLDTQYDLLKDLHTRASNGSPAFLFNAENPEDLKRLETVYLLNRRWEPPLEHAVKDRQSQLDAIAQDLSDHSAILHKPLLVTEDHGLWYTDGYEVETGNVLKKLLDAHCIVLPDKLKDKPLEEVERKSNKDLRNIVGFFTKANQSDAPPNSEHPLMELKFHVIDKIAEAILGTKAKVIPNPLVGAHVPDPGDDAKAAIASVTWKSEGVSRNLTTSSGPEANAKHYELSVKLEGPLSALLAAEAAIERISYPVTVVLGATLSERGNWKEGERKGISVEPMVCIMDIEIIDYAPTQQKAGTAPLPGAFPVAPTLPPGGLHPPVSPPRPVVPGEGKP